MTATMPIPPTNGGLPAGLSSDRVTRGTIARWSANGGWVDRDGLPLPTPMLVIGYTTVLRRWKDKRPEYITEQPLPNPDELNAAIPVAEWEIGLDGRPRKPWAYCYVVYMVDLNTGALFTFAHDTYGTMLAYTALEEQVAVYRMLRGEYVWPIVNLEKRPWKSATYGMQMRPHFQVVDWRAPGGAADAMPAVSPSPTPQLTGPLAATPPTKPAPATPTATTTATPATPPKSSILDATKPVKPVTLAEIVADEIPWK